MQGFSPVHIREAVELGGVAATFSEYDREEKVGEAVIVGWLGVANDDPEWEKGYS